MCESESLFLGRHLWSVAWRKGPQGYTTSQMGSAQVRPEDNQIQSKLCLTQNRLQRRAITNWRRHDAPLINKLPQSTRAAARAISPALHTQRYFSCNAVTHDQSCLVPHLDTDVLAILTQRAGALRD